MQANDELGRLEALINAAPLPMAVAHLDGEVLFINDHAFALFGLRREEDGPLRPALEFFEDAAELSRVIAEGLEGPIKNRELHLKQADGTPMRILVSSEIVEIGGEKVVIAGLQNITELRLAEEALRESEHRFEAMVQSSAGIISILDPNGVIRYNSPAALRTFGFAEGEVIGTQSLDYIHPDDRETVTLTHASTALEPGAVARYECRVRHKDGHYRIVEAIVTNLVNDAAVKGLVVNYWDITERRSVAEAMATSERRWRALIENNPAAILVLDSEGVVQFAGASTERVLGWTPAEMKAVGSAWNALHHDDDVRVRGIVTTVIREPGSQGSCACRVRHKNGRWLDIEAVITNMLDDEDVRGVVVNMHDIGERKQLEEATNLMVWAAAAIGEADTLKSGLDIVLQKVCDVTGWTLGEAWIPSRDGTVMEHISTSRTQNQKLAQFARRSKTLSFAPGAGLPGRVWSSGKPQWVRDVREDPGFFRASDARQAGLKAAVAVPIAAGEEIVGVLDFLMTGTRDEDERLVDLITAVARQIGTLTKRKQLEEALRLSEESFRAIADDSVQGMTILQSEEVVYANRAISEILGCPREELIGMSLEEALALVHPDDRQLARARTDRRTRDGDVPGSAEYRIIRRNDGAVRWVEVHGTGIQFNRAPGLLTIVVDTTERRQSEELLRRLSSVVEQTADAVIMTDPNGTIQYVNPATERTTGYTAKDLLGKNPRIFGSGEMPPRFFKRLWDTILAGRVFRGEFVNRRKDGSLYYEEKVITPIKGEMGEIIQFVSTGRDITERKLAEETIRHMAYHDQLTGLPNRALFIDRANVAIAQAKRSGTKLAVFFLDLDRLKYVNDTLGHGKGDEIIKEVGLEVWDVVREGDTVARMGGDEYAILLTGLAATQAAEVVAGRIVGAVKKHRTMNGQSVTVTASVGIAIYPSDGTDALALLKSADMAMYAAKERGGDGYELYTHLMSVRVRERLGLENDLRLAIESGRLEVHYQPQVSVATGEVVGVEALARWSHPERGPVSPAEFVPVAEETGLIIPLQYFVISTAIDQLRSWESQGLAQFRLAINLSAACLRLHELAANLRSVLRDRRVEPSRVQFEITESMAIGHSDAILDILNGIRDIGCTIALDDFGTGFSSFAHLRQLPIDAIKLDIALVRDIPIDPAAAAIATAVLSMVRELGLTVIAEGVETEEQLEALRERGCHEYQGFLFSKALRGDEVTELLRSMKGTKTRRRKTGG